MKTPDEAKKKAAEEFQKKLDRIDNHGFKEVKILDGNVGYLKFNYFSADQEAFQVAVGAMAFLANCDALIIDLRENGGGNPEMIQLLSSYFFAGEPRHLNSFYYRLDEKTEQYWTLPYVPGGKLAETDLYVLTSSNTFSGAEEFTYNLKNMKRATIVGETTGGGAHPVRMEILNDNFAIGVPYARAVNPISKTNWEGTGIEPDVKVPAVQALAKAHLLALEKLAAKEKDERIKATYQWALDGLKAELNPVTSGRRHTEILCRRLRSQQDHLRERQPVLPEGKRPQDEDDPHERGLFPLRGSRLFPAEDRQKRRPGDRDRRALRRRHRRRQSAFELIFISAQN